LINACPELQSCEVIVSIARWNKCNEKLLFGPNTKVTARTAKMKINVIERCYWGKESVIRAAIWNEILDMKPFQIL
jgi:hypothetical protein